MLVASKLKSYEIKSEVDLFGFDEFARIAFEQIQGVAYEPVDKDNVENRVFKNAIFGFEPLTSAFGGQCSIQQYIESIFDRLSLTQNI